LPKRFIKEILEGKWD